MNRPWRLRGSAIWIFAASSLVAPVAGLTATYCSNFNTGSNYQPVYPQYPSLGACQTQCKSSYAFAIVQGGACWCSNYAPADRVPLSECNYSCKGYPYDDCGNPSQGLFGYLALGIKAAGTEGPQSSSSTPAPSTTVNSPPPPSSSAAPSPSTVTLIKTSTKKVTPSTAKPSVTVEVLTERVTVSGGVVTKQVTSVATADPQINPPLTASNRGLSNGAVAGIVLGAVIAAALVGVFVWIFCCRPKRRRNGKEDEDGGLGRNVSVLSRVGLLRAASQRSAHPPANTAAQNRPAPPPEMHPVPIPSAPPRIEIPTTSRYAGSNHDLYGEPVSAVSADSGGSGKPSSGKRASVPMFTDSRLNLNVITNHPNASKTSVSSLRDDADYSRQLRVANPDA